MLWVLTVLFFGLARGNAGLYRDEVDVKDSFRPSWQPRRPHVVHSARTTTSSEHKPWKRHFPDAATSAGSLKIFRTSNVLTVVVVSTPHHVSYLDASTGELVSERYYDHIAMEHDESASCVDWDADEVCDAVVLVRFTPRDSLQLLVWSGVDARQLWSYTFVNVTNDENAFLIPSQQPRGGLLCCVTDLQCWYIGSQNVFEPTNEQRLNTIPVVATNKTSASLLSVQLGQSRANLDINHLTLHPVAGYPPLPPLGHLWRLSNGTVIGYQVNMDSTSVVPEWRFGAGLMSFCAIEEGHSEGTHGTWSPAVMTGNGQVLKKFLRFPLICVSKTCVAYVLNAVTGSVYASLEAGNCNTPQAIRVFENRFVLVYRSHKLLSSAILIGELYENEQSSVTDKDVAIVRSSVRSLADLSFSVDVDSLTVVRSRRGLVAPLLVFSTLDYRVIAFPWNLYAPPVVLSHARRFVGPPVRQIHVVPLNLESHIQLVVKSEDGDEWNLTITPDGSFDTYSHHDSRKKATLLLVIMALAIAVLITSRVRRNLQLWQRWYV
jgi:hypothetical protein